MDNRFNFAYDALILLPEEAAQLEAIRVAVDARQAAARAAKLAEWTRLGAENGRGRCVRPGEAGVDVVVVRVTKMTLVTRSALGGEFVFLLSNGSEKGGGYYGGRRLDLTYVSPTLLAKLAAAGKDSRNGWARTVAERHAGGQG